MALNREQVNQLLSMIKNTRDVEITCPECLDELDRYVQSSVEGAPIEGMLARVQEHLEACPFCSMELSLVLDTLKAIEN
jgi:uncharacterized protein with PIN domain